MKNSTKTKHSSFKIGELTKGCVYCVEGRKLVLFITGICPRNCWYCPVADNKYQNDAVYANERPVKNIDEVIHEARITEAKGAGITGGDPLAKLDRTVEYIKGLKKEFGKNFHIHLYTSFDLVNEENLEKLFDAGLDEIRLHPDFNENEAFSVCRKSSRIFQHDEDKNWKRIEIVKKFKWKIGIEIPCIPDFREKTFKLIEYFKDKVDFINLNELEAADTEHNGVFDKGYKAKDELSYGISGSEELGLEILQEYLHTPLNIHFCTSRLKNAEQFGNRIKIRAKNVKKHYDIATNEGTLIRGAIYTEKPSFGYQEKLRLKNKEQEIRILKDLKSKLATGLRIPKKDFDVDEIKYRLLCSRRIIYRYKDKIKALGLFPAIVEELATHDLFEIEIDFI